MDRDEEDFVSGSRSDDGGGTPVLDEHPLSDGEEMRSPSRQAEDEGSNDEAPPPAVKRGGASGSENEPDSDSEGEAPGSPNNENKSDSDGEAPPPAGSGDYSPVKRRSSGSEDEESLQKRRLSGSDNEGHSSPTKPRGSSSDLEEGAGTPKPAPNADSEDEDAKAAASPNSDSDAETPSRRKSAQIDSDEEDKPEEGHKEGKWKAVMQSDSEEEEEEGRRRSTAAGSDEDEKRSEDSEEERPAKRKKVIMSDSEDDEEEKADRPAPKRSRAVSDEENSDSDDASVGPDRSLAAKLKELGSDSSSEDDGGGAGPGKQQNKEKALFGSDSESGDEEEKMIADIFGESGDEEEEEFTGFNQEDLEADKKESKERPEVEESDSDEGVDRGGQDTSFMSDFDLMLAKRKAINSRRRRHRDGGTFISDADDVVSAMITKMNEAAEEDRTLNKQKKPALKKLTLLPQVVMHLKKQDLKETFIDSGVMSAITEWISPLPDKSLPALRIREELLRILQELPSVSQETLKHSKIGRAVMFLYKHPKESRPNKDLALKLINEWSRPIFGLTSNYKSMTREERQQRDLDQQMPQRRRLSSGGQTPRRDLEKQLTGEEKALRPGDPGFCARARVPMPSNKDYVVRPKWNVEGDSSRSGYKKAISLLEKHKRRFAEERKLRRPQGAVKISIEGNRMPL
ncbi:protein IWS1 homolog isoform X4 [Oryzias latipes]|uniref:Interacts with SUPT6H, CTD assembly factor 1 n=1 Tax=Oryzias latipes TaxID=8090 RepID=H2N1F6_ORYLA|nr:protein IWS1 homolog isoform X4 [Oryzias latipes]